MTFYTHTIMDHYSKVFALLGFLLVLPVHAQNEQGEGVVRKRFTLAAFEQVTDQQIYYRDGRKMMPVTLKLGRRSEEYKLKADHGLELYIQEINADGESVHVLIGKPAKEKGYAKSLYLIDQSAQKGKLRIFEMNDSTENFPAGAFRFLNLTNLKIGIKLGSAAKVVAPGGISTLPVRIPKNQQFIPMAMYSSKRTLLAGSRMYCQAAAREFIVIYPPLHDKEKIRLRYLNQLLAKAE
jgi:hypothetical protein